LSIFVVSSCTISIVAVQQVIDYFPAKSMIGLKCNHLIIHRPFPLEPSLYLLTVSETFNGEYDAMVGSGVTMGWLLRLVTGGPTGKGAPDSSRVLTA